MTTRYAAISMIAIFGVVVLASPGAQGLTMKECSAKYKAAKDAGTLNGMKWNDFRKAQCGSDAAATPAATPPATSVPPAKTDTAAKPTVTPAATPSTTKQPPAPKPTSTAAATPAGANQFASETQSKAQCPTDTIVWVNLSSKIFHFSGNKSYGTTKNGAYMCEKDATAGGFRAAKNEKHP